jgi:predicted RNase H-like nuclease (RuvC/YqgF family)
MSKDGNGRRSPWDLFAERQVHVRSGDESRYVVLSRPLQIGVAAGFLALLGLLAIASYNAIAKHLTLATQQQAWAEASAASAAQAGDAARELASLRQRGEAAAREIERLTAALDQAQAERMEAITASSEAGAKAAELQAALAASMAAEHAGSGGAGADASGAGSAEVENLRAEVTGLRVELERVNREALALRQARQALQAQADAGGVAPGQQVLATAAGGEEVRRLQQDLAAAQATVSSLSADLETLKGTGAGPATAAAAELARLKEQLGAAHQRAEQIAGSLVGSQPQPDGKAPAATPLPSPPAPR